MWVRGWICQLEAASCSILPFRFKKLDGFCFYFVSLSPPYPQVFKGHIGKAVSHGASLTPRLLRRALAGEEPVAGSVFKRPFNCSSPTFPKDSGYFMKLGEEHGRCETFQKVEYPVVDPWFNVVLCSPCTFGGQSLVKFSKVLTPELSSQHQVFFPSICNLSICLT